LRFTPRALIPSAARLAHSTTARATTLVVAVVIACLTALTLIGGSTTAEAQQPMASSAVAVDPLVAAALSAPAFTTGQFTDFNESINVGLVAATKAQAAKKQVLRARVVSFAKAQIGDSYVAGAAGPNRFDCSGLTRYVFQKITGKSLPHQSHAQYAQVKKIRFADARPGDLVFFFRNGAHHVGVYIGGKKMVDAAGYGEGVRISPITGSWWSRSYSGMGRILPA
jgi:cell wall-associated NlpC family hydrolase